MKLRKGFVSNSSSSSFTCDVCGEEVSGWDMGLSEAEMYECENGHTFCQSGCLKGIKSVDDLIDEIGGKKEVLKKILLEYIEHHKKDKKDYIQEQVEEYKEKLIELDNGNLDEDDIEHFLDEIEFRYSVPEFLCPICTFQVLDDADVSKYMLKKIGQTEDELKIEIKEKFSSYDELKKYLKG